MCISVILSMFVFGFFFFLSQDLSLNLELAKSARLACSQAQGTRCLWSPSTVITGISCSTHFFPMYVPWDGTLALILMHHVAYDRTVSVPGAVFFNEDNPHEPAYIVILVCLWNGIDVSLGFFNLHFLLLFNLFIPSLLPSL